MLEALQEYGPRNITRVAKELGMPAETIRKRFGRLRSTVFLKTHVNIYHTNLGLKKAVVFGEAVPGYEDLLFNALKQNDFWIFVGRCYGTFEGSIGIFTVPKEHTGEFEQFLSQVQALGAAQRLEHYWSTCFHEVNCLLNWFDKQAMDWSFPWDKWLEEINSEKQELPYTLVDPEAFPVLGDEYDVIMLKELEKDATVRIAKLAQILKISPQLARYHFHRHLVGNGLIESFEVRTFHFGRDTADFSFFLFNFDSHEKMAKFASSLLDKPFAKVLGKLLERNALYGYIYLPRSEFRKFLNALSQLVKSGFMESYRYMIQDLDNSSRQTISFEYFTDKSWVYDHEKHLRNLQNLVNNAKMPQFKA